MPIRNESVSKLWSFWMENLVVALARGKTGAAQQSELALLAEDASSTLGSNVDSSA